VDALEELIARSKDCPELRQLAEFHLRNPEVLDFLVQEIRLRLDSGYTAFSYKSLWQYARWQLEIERGPNHTFLMNDNLNSFYARAITILHPGFNGRAEFRVSKADEIFGTEVEPTPKNRPKNYARRLQWEDCTPLERGWRPSVPHEPKPVGRRPSVHLCAACRGKLTDPY
jgi:hypothetical protein